MNRSMALLGLLTSGLFIFSSQALANRFENIPCLASTNPGICVQKIPFEYQVTNNTMNEIVAFGVTNPSDSGPSLRAPFDWDGRSISQTNWDEGFSFEIYSNPEELVTESSPPTGGTSSGSIFTTNQLGTFSSLFGTEDSFVNFYWHARSIDSAALVDGYSQSGFRFGTVVASNIAAFGINNNGSPTLLATSLVPEADTYILLMVSLGVLGMLARHKKLV